ncbi:unnamed protein product [Alopecurus aequalis]
MAGSGVGATTLGDLPEWIVVEEILVRLSPKYLVRCRAVRKYWHSATSSDKFTLDHRRRQPLLPILSHSVDHKYRRLLVSGDAGVGQERLCPVIKSYGYGKLQAALDGLFIVSHADDRTTEFFVCNPVTHKCAPLGKPQIRQGFHHRIVGFYRHQPSGEYRVLWGSSPTYWNAYDTNYQTFYYVIAVGSDNARCIRRGCVPRPVVLSPSLELVLCHGLPGSSGYPPVHHRGNMHWKFGNYHGVDEAYIMVFDTAAETFRLMCRPAQLRPRDLLLLEMDGTLALCSFSIDRDTIDVWVIQDYDTETWSFKRQINLSGVDPSPPVDSNDLRLPCPRIAVLKQAELLIQFTQKRVLRYDMDGKFLGHAKNDEGQENKLWITKHYHQESVVSLPRFHEI